MRDGLAPLNQEGVVEREEDRIATGLRHTKGNHIRAVCDLYRLYITGRLRGE
jgi:hypothetical protein